MTTIEYIIEEKLHQHLNEISMYNRRESKNVEDRRFTLTKAEKKALKLCREAQPKLKKLGDEIKEFVNVFLVKESQTDEENECLREIVYKLANIRIPNSGNPKNDFNILYNFLEYYTKRFNIDPFFYYEGSKQCIHGWLLDLNIYLRDWSLYKNVKKVKNKVKKAISPFTPIINQINAY